MKLLRVSVLALAALFSLPALAEKVAVLGIQEALLSSQAAKDFRLELQQQLSADEKQLAELEKQAKAARDKVQKNKDLVAKDELKQMNLQFQKVFAEYQRQGQALQQKRAQAEQAFLAQMRPKLDTVIRQLIEQEQYDLVVAKQATLFAKKELDITARVVELLNKQP
ncbi:OmpH family outer membrane protein [Marinobacterium arenosum]|uniref:OmpH family outer membrane protein n=1 Tax=Marinobacterium arenosum TaxID=2862496 RepID=UPI001C96BACD|nr:OmpH family outer membrane protein [Marinobacterium arenosum]MBY4675651.1 OmpH family outer membrane protein [Marinobacterium arenosum]